VEKEKPVPVEVLKRMGAEHVPKASLVTQKHKKNAMNALLGFFNRKTQNPVNRVQHVHRGGLKEKRVNRFATTPVASNPKIVKTMNIGYPINLPTNGYKPVA